jgi:membrane protein
MHPIERVEQQVEHVEQRLSRYRRHWAVVMTRNYLADDADGLASIIAFAAMFSLMPILIVTFMLVTLLLQLNTVKDVLPGVIADDVPPYIAERVEAVVQAGADNVASLGIVAFITFLLGGGKLYFAIDRACARIFQIERQVYAKRKLFALLMMPLIPALLLAATLVSAIATAVLTLPIESVTEIDPTREALLASYLTSFLIAFGLTLAAYQWIPKPAPGFRHASEGAAVAALLMVLLAQFFPVYLKLADGYSLYGSLFAFILVLLFWLYLVGQIFVIGAEVTAYRSGRRESAS